MGTDIKRNIWTADPYVFKASQYGLKIFDLSSGSLIQMAEFPEGFNSVWSNDQYVYVATTISGVYRTPISTVTGTVIFEPFKSFPDITDNYVNYIHGNGDYLCAVTLSGVDRYKFSNNEREYVFVENPSKCFQTTIGDYYYYTNPPISIEFESTKLYAMYNSGGSYIYEAKQDNIIESSYINDLHVTENTSIYGGNVMFIATTQGAYVIEERRGQEDSCRYRIYLIET